MRKPTKKTRTCVRFGFVLEGKTLPEKIGARIAEVRQKRRLSISSIARFLKIDESLVRRWEAGYLIPPEHYLDKLAFLLGVDAPWLLHLRGYYSETDGLTGATDVPGMFLTIAEERAFHNAQKLAAEEEKKRLAKMYDDQEAAKKIDEDRKAAQAAAWTVIQEKKKQRAEKLRFETPYYRAQRAAKEAEAKAEAKRLLRCLEGLDPEQQEDFLFFEALRRGHQRRRSGI